MTKIYRRNKKTVWDFFGNECARCGCTHNLQLDHIDPKTKKFDVSQKLGGRLGPLWEEIRKCQLLCEPCHKQKTKEDQKIIQEKRKGFIHEDRRYNPLLQEHVIDITIDESKKHGKAYIKYVKHKAKMKGIPVEDVVKEHWGQMDKYDLFVYWKDWDKLIKQVYSDKEQRKVAKAFLEREYLRLQKEEPQLYEKFKRFYEDEDDDEEESKIPFPKVVDDLIEYDMTEVHFPENYGDSND